MLKPRITVAVPFHWMENWQFFLTRCLESIEKQTYKDYEVVLVKYSNMPTTSNRAIQSATGDIVKVLYMDDYLFSPEALEHLANSFKGGWAMSGCVHDNGEIRDVHYPRWNDDIKTGANTLGSPSLLAFENDDPLMFDEKLSWLLDCDLYHRLHERYGEPTLINYPDVAIGIHNGQMTNILTREQKQQEGVYVANKYGN